MGENQTRGKAMTFSPTAIALIAVLITGYIAGVSLGTIAYFANEKNY